MIATSKEQWSTGMSENPTSDEIKLLEKLALGLLTYPSDPRVAEPRLFLGKIPENLPVQISVPEKSRILGTLARSETHVEIVLESDLKPEEIASFYRTQLASQGWHEPEDMQVHRQGGFLHSSIGPYTNMTFCQESSIAGLTLSMQRMQGTATSIRLNLSLDREMNPCAQQTRDRRQMTPHQRHLRMFEMIPPLAPPFGTRQRSGGGSSGTDEVYTTASLKTDLALDAVVKHYADQLIQGGWMQTGAGADGPLAWSTWHFTAEEQEPWSGLFFVLKTPEKPNDYYLYIRATWVEPEDDQKGSGWYSNIRI